MNKSALFKRAHALTKEIIKAGYSYRATFGLAIKYILENESESETSTYIIEVFNGMLKLCFVEVEATSHKDAVEKYESTHPRSRPVCHVSKKVTDVDSIIDADDLLYEMDMNRTDKIVVIENGKRKEYTRKQVLASVNHKQSASRMTREKALAM